MQSLSIFFIIFALAQVAIDANTFNVPQIFNIKTSSKNVILVVRDLNNHANYEFCAVQKYRSPFEQRPRLHSNSKNSNMVKYHNMIDMSFISQKCSNLRDNLIAKFNQRLDAVHIRFDDFSECSINKIVRRVRTNTTKIIIVGTSNENLVKIDKKI